ncbi:MAG: S41 family peptidase [Oscillospiraceae bacterium]|nr:S41 family peptidase [Oscillospiraceae bacterium]
MKKRVNIITVVVLMALVGLVTYIITYSMVQRDFNQRVDTFSRHRQEWGPFYAALENIENRYIGGTDSLALMQGAIGGMVRATGDTWSYYYTPEAYRDFLDQQRNQYSGIGVYAEDGGGGIRLVEIMDKSPAEEAGLLAGDIITHVDDVAVADVGYDAAVGLVRGEEYTLVSLTVERPGEGTGSFIIDVMRREIVIDRVVSATIEQAGGKIGVVRVTGFNDHVDTEFIDKVGELLREGVQGLVLDVRSNGGGKLDVLVNMLDYLLPEGELITLRYWDGRVVTHSSGPDSVNLPMAVLIDDNSVSAAEFFAVCLQEYEWAVLVGEQTGGKGYAQEHLRLPDNSSLYLSTSEYVTSKGRSLADTGVTPDIELVLAAEERRHIGSMDPVLDRQLGRALQALSGR